MELKNPIVMRLVARKKHVCLTSEEQVFNHKEVVQQNSSVT